MHSIERPSAQVRDASVTAAGLGGVSGSLRLDVTNPNTFGVPLSGIDWQLAIGGSRAATGNVELQQTIPARGVAPVNTSLAISTMDAVNVVQAVAGGAREYQLDATLHFSTNVGQLDVSVHYTGHLQSAIAGF
ncbi:MAG: LEA type 2 family protein [Deltaproteobacteria bacterium]|nr:LEA type 2 family protein [Deltaproteobacteria bacterium]